MFRSAALAFMLFAALACPSFADVTGPASASIAALPSPTSETRFPVTPIPLERPARYRATYRPNFATKAS